MTALASRYNLALLLLLGLAVALWAFWSRSPSRAEPCAEPGLLAVTSLIPGSRPLGEHMEGRSEDVIQWSEGELAVDGDGSRDAPLRFQIIRFYGSPRKMLRPYSLVEDLHFEADHSAKRQVDTVAGPVGIQVLYQKSSGPSGIVAYFYAQDGDAFSNAFLRLIASAPTQLLHGARPITLFVVSGPARRIEPAVERAVEWLSGAWVHYRRACTEAR